MGPMSGTPAPAAGGQPAEAAAAAFDALRRDPVVQALLAACGATECHLVGGALRDRALGLATHDLDAVVAGRGHEIAAELAASLPARLVPLGGRDFAAYRLVIGAGETAVGVLDLWDRQSASLHDDLARRDFTVNSFAVEPRDGAVFDPFGGLADLAQRTLRATTAGSFDGDPLRVLRLARLLAHLPGFSVEPETLELARHAAARLPEMAAERIREELRLLLSHPAAAIGLHALAALDLYPGLWLGAPGLPGGGEGAAAAERAAAEIVALPHCAGELESLLGTPGIAGITAASAASAASEPASGNASFYRVAGARPAIDLAAARIAASFRQLPNVAGASGGAAAAGALGRMREAGYVSARQEAAVAPLLAEPAALPETDLERRRFLHRHGWGWLTVACSWGGAAAAAGGAARERWRHAAGPLCELARRAGPELIDPPRLLTGDDVQRLLGVAAGPAVGAALAALTAAQVAGTVCTRADAERFLGDWRARLARETS